MEEKSPHERALDVQEKSPHEQTEDFIFPIKKMQKLDVEDSADNNNNIVEMATRTLTCLEKQWSYQCPDFRLNVDAYSFFKKAVEKHPEQINQTSRDLAKDAYEDWQKRAVHIRHRIPFAHETFERHYPITTKDKPF